MIINTNKNLAQNLLDRAIDKFLGAYKIPSFPKIKKMSLNSITYDWKDLKATFTLQVLNLSANFVITQITQSQDFIVPPFLFYSEDELIDRIVECLEYWVNNCMEG